MRSFLPARGCIVAAAWAVVAVLTSCGGNGSAVDRPRALEAFRDLRIGSVDDPETSFTWFEELEVGPEGRIFTLHPREDRIRVHSPAGEPLDPIGRPGEGPGEFQNLRDMGFVADTLWVLDAGTYRFSFFSPAGELYRSVRVPIELGEDLGSSPPRPRGLLSDGRLHGAPPARSRLVATGELERVPLVRMDTAGRVADTLAVRPLRNTSWMVRDPDRPNAWRSFRPQPFADADLVELSPYAPEVVRVERPAAASSEVSTFRVTRRTFADDTLFVRNYSYRPVPIATALVDSLVFALANSVATSDFLGGPASVKAAAGWARSSLYRPDFHPPVTELVFGRDGTLWLRREDTGADSVSWDLLGKDGRVVGRTRLPDALRVMEADRKNLWGMETGELGVPKIVRYAISAPSANY